MKIQPQHSLLGRLLFNPYVQLYEYNGILAILSQERYNEAAYIALTQQMDLQGYEEQPFINITNIQDGFFFPSENEFELDIADTQSYIIVVGEHLLNNELLTKWISEYAQQDVAYDPRWTLKDLPKDARYHLNVIEGDLYVSLMNGTTKEGDIIVVDNIQYIVSEALPPATILDANDSTWRKLIYA